MLFVAAGFLALGLGILGIILPVVPTTPLLLLASFCFMKGSKRFEVWFKQTGIYKKHLESFVKNKSMTLKQKFTILLFADAMIIIAFFLTDITAVRIMLVIIVLYKYYYFFYKIKTLPE
ncbi:YbaN family protein [Bacillus infantis]|uniref:YbaN family protein n=1 Tax=Bacillus infantis TaxID=324767 RepID=UPI001CD39358|nr:YbaN family protein [Bacillus infantis]MCR6609677.1 YbaN family protein [Bacillus infantis]